jgi:RNA polymerase primary sigma factor
MAAVQPASLDAPMGTDETHSIGDTVKDENADTPYERLEGKAVNGMLQEMVKTLTPREATILRARFGLDGKTPQTLDEVGGSLNVTRERVRQIQNKALKQLRAMVDRLEKTKTED